MENAPVLSIPQSTRIILCLSFRSFFCMISLGQCGLGRQTSVRFLIQNGGSYLVMLITIWLDLWLKKWKEVASSWWRKEDTSGLELCCNLLVRNYSLYATWKLEICIKSLITAFCRACGIVCLYLLDWHGMYGAFKKSLRMEELFLLSSVIG